MDRTLDSVEAARRLGVKRSTLYVYVSRGLLRPERAPDGRRSLFSVEEVERLASRSRTERRGEGRASSAIVTSVTQITDSGPRYRGVAASSLLGRPFEEVAELIWQAPPAPWQPLELTIPSHLPVGDRLRLGVVLAAAVDPVRSDRRPESVVAAARRVIITTARSLADHQPAVHGPSVAEHLAAAMRPDGDRIGLVAALDASLALLADDGASVSTRAVRLAASTRADLYDALLAGLGVLGGPLQGGASVPVVELVRRCRERGVERTVDEQLRWQASLPGFGSDSYPGGDPRFAALRPFVEDLADDADAEVLDRLVGLAERRGMPAPTVDLALGALVHAAGASPSFGPATVAIAKLAGFTAHYLEELGEAPSRFSDQAVYASASPGWAGREVGGEAGRISR